MPNWCKGTIKFRGTTKNMIKCLKGLTGGEAAIGYNDGDEEFVVSIPESYVNGTTRAFIEGETYDIVNEKTNIVTLCFDIRGAWCFVPKQWQKISEDYDVNIHIHAFEKGMCFEQILEVIHGVITHNEQKEYEDYEWDAYDPRLGG